MFGERFVDIGPDQEWTSEKPEPPKPANRPSRREFLGGVLAATFTAATIGCKEEKSGGKPPAIPENSSEPVSERSHARENLVPTHTGVTEPEPLTQNETKEPYQSPNVQRLELNKEESDKIENEKFRQYLHSMASASRDNLVIIDISADWCGACNHMKPFFEKGADRIAQRDLPVLFSNVHLVDGAQVDEGRSKVILDFLKKVNTDRRLVGYYKEIGSFSLPLVIYLHKGKLIRLQNSVGEFITDGKLTQQSFDAFIDRCLDGDCGSYFDEGQKNPRTPEKSSSMFAPIGDIYKEEYGINKLHNKKAQWKGIKRKKSP